MRVLTLLLICLSPIFAMAQDDVTLPDASPSVPVETSALELFEPSREDAVLEAYVDGLIAAHRREHDTPGVAVSVVHDGRLVFAKGYGVADIETGATVDGHETLFRIGSITKTFVWTAAMMLVERGSLDLDADINTYLEDFQIPEKFDAPITMHHLMAHRAGFEDSFSLYTKQDGENEVSLSTALQDDLPVRVYPPGQRTAYSNYGTALAARVIENISGQGIEAFIESEILAPLGMTKATLAGPSEMPANKRNTLSNSLRVENGVYRAETPMQIGPYAPVGAMAAPAAEMARWMLFHLGRGEHDGVRLMRNDTHDAMWRRAFTDRPDGADLAHGFFNVPYRGLQTYGHGGATAAFYSDMVMVPELGLGIFISQNATNNRTLINEFAELVIDFVMEPRSAQSAKTKIDVQPYIGAYLTNRRSFTTFMKINASQDVTKIAAANDGALTVATASGADTYFPTEQADVFENKQTQKLVFNRNEKGAVTHFTRGRGIVSYEKVGFFSNPIFLNISIGAAFFFSVTTWLGAWRRQGRGDAPSATARRLSLGAFTVAGLVFAFLGAVIATTIVAATTSGFDLLLNPPISFSLMQTIGLILLIAAPLILFSLWPAWTSSGWSLWRKSHHTAFALAFLLLGGALIKWNFVLTPLM